MPEKFDILIKNAQIRSQSGKFFQIGITDGKIKAIEEQIDCTASAEIDAQGNLVTESFVNPHLHLCKVYTLQMMDEKALRDYHEAEMGKAMTAIELAARVKEKYDETWIIQQHKFDSTNLTDPNSLVKLERERSTPVPHRATKINPSSGITAKNGH